MKIPTFNVVRKVPNFSSDYGSIGDIAYDYEAFYIYTNKGWRSIAFSGINSDVPNTVLQNHNMTNYAFATTDYFFLYTSGVWRTFAISMLDNRLISKGGPIPLVLPIYRFRLANTPSINTAASGVEGMVSYNDEYFYIYSSGMWRSHAISDFSAKQPVEIIPPPLPVPAPDNLITLQIDTSESVSINWEFTGSYSLIDGFVIERSLSPFIIFNTLQTIPSSFISSSMDSTVIFNNDYAYKIYAYKGIRNSTFSNIAETFIFPPPGPPMAIPVLTASLL